MIEIAGERDGDATDITMTPGDCRCSILTYVDTCGIELHKVLACLNQTAMTNKTSSEAL